MQEMPKVNDEHEAHYHQSDGKPGQRNAPPCYCVTPLTPVRPESGDPDKEPALAQHLIAPMHRRTGQPRWLYAIYAIDGTLLHVIQWSSAMDWPKWVDPLARLDIVEITVGEYNRWVAKRPELQTAFRMAEGGQRNEP
jgi:hypothetical protein